MLRSHNYDLYASNNPRHAYAAVTAAQKARPHSWAVPNPLDLDLEDGNEALIPKRTFVDRGRRPIRETDMIDEVVIERRVSHGRGGAGNFRRPSESGQIVERVIDDEGNVKWRRSSARSQTDEKAAKSRRASINKFVSALFGRKGSTTSTPSVEDVAVEEP